MEAVRIRVLCALGGMVLALSAGVARADGPLGPLPAAVTSPGTARPWVALAGVLDGIVTFRVTPWLLLTPDVRLVDTPGPGVVPGGVLAIGGRLALMF
ncbi:MAG: hypothetical protein U0807_13965 [Candidatus Binatia bacterium]